MVEREGLGDFERGHEQQYDSDARGLGTSAKNILEARHAKGDIGVRARTLTCFRRWAEEGGREGEGGGGRGRGEGRRSETKWLLSREGQTL